MDGKDLYFDADLTGPLVLVVGAEGKGVGRLVKENCDFLSASPCWDRSSPSMLPLQAASSYMKLQGSASSVPARCKEAMGWPRNRLQ